jgi:hypothetical protein
MLYPFCTGNLLNLYSDHGSYITVPLGNHQWVSCATYAPNGQLFESDSESRAEVLENQVYWAQKGWGAYEPEAICQLW